MTELPPDLPPTATFATWPERVAATLLDMAFLIAAVIVLAPVSYASDALGPIVGLVLLGVFLYFQWLNGSRGGSPGKAMLGLKVVHATSGGLIGGPMGIVRYLVATALSVLTCGILSLVDYLFPLWDSRRQTIHDKAVSSVVITNQARAKFVEAFKP